MAGFKVVIPARYASTRLPGKPLLDIAGKPMVIRVAEQARASGADSVIVATDHKDILEVVESHGFPVLMTRADHASGTDRIAEVSSRFEWPDEEIVVNVQGDEPLIAPDLIRDVASSLAMHPDAAIATACYGISDKDEMFNPNVVKVVTDRNGYALYFSRAAIPWARDFFSLGGDALPEDFPVYRHIGIYAYRAGFLKEYAGLEPSPIERFEALEQLRALWHGYRISVTVARTAPATGVDTDADLQRVRAVLRS